MGHGWARSLGCLTLYSLIFLACASPEDDALARDKVKLEYERSGFQWMTPKTYSLMDKENNKQPYIFTFLSSRCYLCRGLLEHMASRESQTWLSSLSAQYNAVMIFDGWGWEYVSPAYTPEGMGYVPRTLFAWPNGTVRTDLISRNAGLKDQFYYLPRELLFQMMQVLKEHYNQTEPYISDLIDDLPS